MTGLRLRGYVCMNEISRARFASSKSVKQSLQCLRVAGSVSKHALCASSFVTDLFPGGTARLQERSSPACCAHQCALRAKGTSRDDSTDRLGSDRTGRIQRPVGRCFYVAGDQIHTPFIEGVTVFSIYIPISLQCTHFIDSRSLRRVCLRLYTICT